MTLADERDLQLQHRLAACESAYRIDDDDDDEYMYVFGPDIRVLGCIMDWEKCPTPTRGAACCPTRKRFETTPGDSFSRVQSIFAFTSPFIF